MKKRILTKINLILSAVSLFLTGCGSSKHVTTLYGPPTEKMYGPPTDIIKEPAPQIPPEPVKPQPAPSPDEPTPVMYGAPYSEF